jgi:hypothetical protein
MSGAPGTQVTLTGSGFPPGEIVAIYIDLPSPYIGSPPPGPVADSVGAIHTSFKWPGKNYDPNHKINPAQAGIHLVCADTGYPGGDQPIRVKSCAPFMAIAAPESPTPAASPSNAASIPELVVALAIVIALVVGAYLSLRGAAASRAKKS